MSKKQFKAQASSGRAFGGSSAGAALSGTFGSHASPLSYVYEAPDLGGIADANVAVTFKNLMKKDATTKAKALEELQAHLAPPHVDVEDALLTAWVRYSIPALSTSIA